MAGSTEDRRQKTQLFPTPWGEACHSDWAGRTRAAVRLSDYVASSPTETQASIKRDVVMRLLKQLNPRGTALRTRRRFTRRTYHSMGPNYVWHVDGYDKLKPFGLALSGCIDGFSRKIMWLVCGPTNNNSSVIAHNYINCAKSVGVVPMRLRTDLRTENGTMAAIQCTLRHAHTDYYAGSSSHSYGSSTANQRIESWWSFFRRRRLVHLCLKDEKYSGRCIVITHVSA